MNFFRRDPEPRDFAPNLGDIAQAMSGRPPSLPPLQRRPDEFAPHSPREIARAIATIESFGALPLKEIDDRVAALKREVEETEALGQKIRDIIMGVRQDYIEKLDHSQAVNRLTRESLARLAEQVAELEAPPAATVDVDQQQDEKAPVIEHEQDEKAA